MERLFSFNLVGSTLLVEGGFHLIVMCGYAPLEWRC